MTNSPRSAAALIAFFQYLSHLPIFVGHIAISPPEHVVTGCCRSGRIGSLLARPVASAQRAFRHQVGRNRLQIVRPSDQRERVDEQRRQVQLVVEQLGVFVVPRERVVIIVPPVAERGHRNDHVFGGIYVPGRQKNTSYKWWARVQGTRVG